MTVSVTATPGLVTIASPWRKAIDSYLDHLRLDLARRPGTIRLRRNHLVRLRAFAGGDPWDVTTATLLAWMRTHEHWRPESRKSAQGTVRSFYGWAVIFGLVDRNPATALPPVVVPRALPRPIPDHQIRVALEGATARERLMVLLGGECGLRAAEIAGVHSRDLDGDVLVVTGKGLHQRAVPVLNTEVLAAIRGAGGWLFPNRRGSHLSPGHVVKLMSWLLPEHYTAHTLRHRAGSVAYASSQDLRGVQELLGHASVRTTERYVHVSSAALRRAAAGAVGVTR